MNEIVHHSRSHGKSLREPTPEQVAWATMVVGELNRMAWPGDGDTNLAELSFFRTMRLAELLNHRESE